MWSHSTRETAGLLPPQFSLPNDFNLWTRNGDRSNSVRPAGFAKFKMLEPLLWRYLLWAEDFPVRCVLKILVSNQEDFYTAIYIEGKVGPCSAKEDRSTCTVGPSKDPETGDLVRKKSV